jgi:hypothetical protein
LDLIVGPPSTEPEHHLQFGLWHTTLQVALSLCCQRYLVLEHYASNVDLLMLTRWGFFTDDTPVLIIEHDQL